MKWLRVLLALLLIFSLVSIPAPVKATEAIGVNLIVNNYLNNSTGKALAWIIFDSPQKPNPGAVDNLIFEWVDSDGIVAFIDVIDPDDEAVAWSSFKVEKLGLWSVNVSYETNSSIHNNKTFNTVTDHWGPGTVIIPQTTLVSEDAILTIEPGTTIAFDQNKSLGVEGKIIAQGTDLDPIVFTSNIGPPSPGDWGSLTIYNKSDSSSVLDYIEVRYSREGLILNGASVNVTNSTFVNNREVAIHAISSNATIKDNYIERGQSGISPFGILSAGSHLLIESNEIRYMSTGIYLLNTNDTTVDNLVTDSETLGMFVVNSNITSTGDTQLDNWNAVEIKDNSKAVFERLTISGYKEGFAAFEDSNATLWNSTVEDVEILTFELAQSCNVTLVNTTFSTLSGNPGISIGAEDDSMLIIQYFLTVEVISYDNGSHLANASVGVWDIFGLTILETAPNGLTPTVVVTDDIYIPTRLNFEVVIGVDYPNTSFQNNYRLVDVNSNRIEIFNGSIHDLDRDGEPDFSDEDDDADGLADDIESSIGTDPRDPDSDDDGLPDGYEFDNPLILDPLLALDASQDPDEDGLSNLDEYLNGTLPDQADSDSDGVDDLKEMDCGMNPLNQSDADDDWDDDGYSNGRECKAGTDLVDADDYPREEFNWLLVGVAIVIIGIVLIIVSVLLTKRRAARTEEEPVEDEEEPSEEESEKTE